VPRGSPARPERRVPAQVGHSCLLFGWETRPELGSCLLGQLQPGLGGALRGAQAAHRRAVQEGQRDGAALLRASLAGFAVKEALPQKRKRGCIVQRSEVEEFHASGKRIEKQAGKPRGISKGRGPHPRKVLTHLLAPIDRSASNRGLREVVDRAEKRLRHRFSPSLRSSTRPRSSASGRRAYPIGLPSAPRSPDRGAGFPSCRDPSLCRRTP
jgi:hypothetical protein